MSGEPNIARNRDQLLDTAWEVAKKYRAHGAYGSEKKACQALARRSKGFTERQVQNAIKKAILLYDATVELVAVNADSLLKNTNVVENVFPDFEELASEVRRRCLGFPMCTYLSAAKWVFIWHHLM